MKTFRVVILVAIMMLISTSALAADYDIDGQIGILNIPAGTHRIYDSNLIGPESIQIVCAQGTTLTLDEVSISNIGVGECALSFTGVDNILILEGTSFLTSGSGEPGIRVESADSTELIIIGSGSLTVTGGDDGAGIGSGNGSSSGYIEIAGGTIIANGIGRAAGIGAGNDGHGSETVISGGEVTAYGSGTASAIGADRNGGLITITDGVVKAYGSPGGAGIGGGSRWNSGEINISGGTIYAQGGTNGAAIGSGREGTCGDISITGGYVYAEGDIAAQDIGNGFDASGGTLEISGLAEVFLHNGVSLLPTTSHAYEPDDTLGGGADVTGAIDAYRMAGVDTAWESATTGYFVVQPQAINPETGDRTSLQVGAYIIIGSVVAILLTSVLKKMKVVRF